MGSCFSKCSTKKQISHRPLPPPLRYNDNVQEKFVISQSLASRHILPLLAAPPSSSKSTSFSSSCSVSINSCMTTSCSSNSSLTLTSKDRSFYNEFLWSCVNENLHAIKLSSRVTPAGSVTVLAAPLRSPSPSRRFEGNLRGSSSPHYIPRTNYVQPSLRKQCTFRPTSPNQSSAEGIVGAANSAR